MKITYQAAGSAANFNSAATLVDESAGGVVVDWQPRGTIAIQRDPLAVLPGTVNAAFRQPLGNVTQTLPLVLEIQYASRAAALAAIQTQTVNLLTVKNDLQVLEPANGSGTVLYYQNAVCTAFEADLHGQSVTYRLTFETDLVTTTYA